MAGPIHCTVITPEQKLFETDTDSVVLPAYDGLLGVLKNHSPLVCELGKGILRVGDREFRVEGGFAQVLDNQVTVLTEKAAPIEGPHTTGS